MELRAASTVDRKISSSAYANLIKSSWTLVDIIACHPQIHFVTASTRLDVQLLSAELKNEFARLSSSQAIIPDLGEMQVQDLRIWESNKSSPLRPRRDAPTIDAWTAASGERVLFQGFALSKSVSGKLTDLFMVLLLVQDDVRAARLVAQHQDGSNMMTVTCTSLSFNLTAIRN